MNTTQDTFYLTGLAPRGMRRLVDYLLLAFSLVLGAVLVRATQLAEVQALATRYAIYLVLCTVLVLVYFLTRAVAVRVEVADKELVLEGYSSLARKRRLPLSAIAEVVRVEGSHHLVRLGLAEGGAWTIALDEPDSFVACMQPLLEQGA